MSSRLVRVSWQRSADGSPLGKAHSLGDDGTLISSPARRYVEGCTIVETFVETLEELYDQALEHGGSAHRLSGTFRPGRAGQTLHTDGRSPTATKADLAHRDEPGVLCIDIDKGAAGWLTHDEVVEGLRAAIPWLRDVALLVIDSSGSCVTLDGIEARRPGSFHVYALLESAVAVPELLMDAHQRCFLAGLGRCVVTGGGAIVERSPVDLALRTPTQPDFMVPHLGSPRLGRSRGPSFYPGERIPAAVALLSGAEVAHVKAVVTALKEKCRPEREAVITTRAAQAGARAHAKLGGDLAEHVASARRSYETNRLESGFVLQLGNGRSCTVAELVVTPSLAGSGWSLPDPLDPEYGEGKARLFDDDGQFSIYSFAHGGRTYILEEAQSAKSAGEAKCEPTFIMGKEGPKAILENIYRALREPGWDGLIVFDQLALRPILLKETPAHKERCRGGNYPHAWDDSDDALVTAWLQAECSLYVRPNQLQAAVLAASHLHPVHAVRDYLDALQWDRVPRLDTWLQSYLGVLDGPLIRAFGSKFLISAVARARLPGTKVDHMLILEGSQGDMKSSALEALMPAPELFTDDLGDALGKDAAERIAGKWLVEVAELDAMKRAEVTRIKSFITRRVDRFRPAYGHWALDAPRQCVFAGSTNADAYLKDETGGRRFWPVRIGAIDLKALRAARDQLWAEAHERYAAGEHWWLEDKELIAAARAQQQARFVEDVWQPAIERLLGKSSEVTISTVLQELNIPLERQGQPEQNRVAKTLRVLGWERVQVRHGDQRVWVYRPSPVSPVTTPDLNIRGEQEQGSGGALVLLIGSALVTGDTGDSEVVS